MKRLQVFPIGRKLAAVSRRPLALLMAGFIVLASLPSAAERTGRGTAPSAGAYMPPGREPALQARIGSTLNRRNNPKQPAAARVAREDAQLPDLEPPRKPKPPAVAKCTRGCGRGHPRGSAVRGRTTAAVQTAGVPRESHPWGPGLCWPAICQSSGGPGRVAVMVGQRELRPGAGNHRPQYADHVLRPGVLGSTGTVDPVRRLRLERRGPQRSAVHGRLLVDLRSFAGAGSPVLRAWRRHGEFSGR